MPPLFSTKIAIDIAATVGGDEAVMGWTAANGGGEQSRYEVLDFSYDGPNVAKPTAEDSLVVQEVYVRGSTWIGQDNNPATTTFMEHLAEKGLGHDTYGYRLFGPGRTPSPQNPDDVLPWINMDQLGCPLCLCANRRRRAHRGATDAEGDAQFLHGDRRHPCGGRPDGVHPQPQQAAGWRQPRCGRRPHG